MDGCSGRSLNNPEWAEKVNRDQLALIFYKHETSSGSLHAAAGNKLGTSPYSR